MKKYIYKLLAIAMNLQMFAEAGTAVNATGSMVNAYTGATTAYDGNGFNGELKTFYDTELLENARAEMYYAQFAKRQTLPANHGVTVEWRKFNTFEKVLLDAQNRLRMVDGDLEKLVGVRTRQINRRLKDVDVIELPKSEGEMLEQ